MNKFHCLGTKHKTYLKRFIKLYSNKNIISFNKIDKNNIEIFGDNIEIDKFSSISTFKQFFLVCESLGFVVQTASCYEVINQKFDFKNVTSHIFNYSQDKDINCYRYSRKICFLYLLNLFKKNDIKKRNIIGKKGKIIEINSLEKETSWWENEAISSWENIQYVIERIKDEYKI